jgi:hypothetical protein
MTCLRSDTELGYRAGPVLKSMHASFQDEGTNCYNNLDEIPFSIRKCEPLSFRVNFAALGAVPACRQLPGRWLKTIPGAMPTAARDTDEYVQEKLPLFTIFNVQLDQR